MTKDEFILRVRQIAERSLDKTHIDQNNMEAAILERMVWLACVYEANLWFELKARDLAAILLDGLPPFNWDEWVEQIVSEDPEFPGFVLEEIESYV